MSTSPTLTVLLFAQAREAAGTARLELLWSGGDTAALRARLAAEHPALRAVLEASALAVNQQIAAPDSPVAPGDEVAILPPFGGG